MSRGILDLLYLYYHQIYCKKLYLLSQTTLWTRIHVSLRDKSKAYLYHNAYGHQNWQDGYIQ